MPNAGGVKRRIARDATSRAWVKDLWFGMWTPEKLLTGSARMPRSLEAVVDLSVAELSDSAMSWEETLMAAQETAMFRALAARLNFLGVDRAGLQFSVNETSRKVANL